MKGTIDPTWEKIHNSQDWGGYPSEHVIRFVARNYYAEDRRTIKLLDFGCGQGAHTWYLAREGFATYAFDGSPSAVKKCKEKLMNENLKAEVQLMDGGVLDYDSDFFDAVIDNACVYANEMKIIRGMYAEIYRVLKPEGKLLTVCFGEEMAGYRTGEEFEHNSFKNIKEGNLSDRGITHIYTETEIIELLSVVGFRDVHCDWIKYLDKGEMVHQYVCTGVK